MNSIAADPRVLEAVAAQPYHLLFLTVSGATC